MSPCLPEIVIVAGGTGGHIAPALAVGEALAGRANVTYVCGSRPLEIAFYARHGASPVVLPLAGSPPRGLGFVAGVARNAAALTQSLRLLRARRPRAVLAMGGYVCAPLLVASRLSGVPYFLHESNAVPGRLIRLFARGAEECLVGFETCAEALRALGARASVAGMPVRGAAADGARTEIAPTLLVLGGSLGARGLNDCVFEALALLEEKPVPEAPLGIVWSAGERDFARVEETAKCFRSDTLSIEVHATIADMAGAYSRAALVVSRSGAGTLSELAHWGLPSILVPFPGAADNHQEANALEFERAGAAEMVVESQVAGRFLAARLAALLGDPRLRAAMACCARALATPDAGPSICNRILDHSQPGSAASTLAPRAEVIAS